MHPLDFGTPTGSRPMPLPRLGEVLPAVVQRFSHQRLLGVVLVDAAPLSAIEGANGYAAYSAVMTKLGALVREVADEMLDGEQLVVGGASGRSEIAVLLFRSEGDGSFYRSELPVFVRSVGKALEQRGSRVAYPYVQHAPALGIGYAAVVRNSFLGADSQLRGAIDEAREDAALRARAGARRRRHTFMGIVLAGEVTSVYEPIVDVTTKTVYAYEALARGPEGTEYRSPDALFEAAEDEGLLFELDCLCRRSGLDGAQGLPSGTALFLNVLPTTIHDPNFKPDALIRTLERSRLQPSDVVFEISEKQSIASFDVFREIRDEYRSLGFRFALDDTGSGYASLQSVIELEPEFIKVDRALVTGLDIDPAKQSLLRALQGVASSFGARIIGEGLDTLEELEMLEELEIPFGQGWLFGKPTPLRAAS